MANNYVQFAFYLPLPDTEKQRSLIPEWFSGWMNAEKNCDELREGGSYWWNEEWDNWFWYSMELDSEQQLLVFSDEYGSVEAAANITQLYLEDFGIDGGVVIEWVEGGGAVVVTRNDMSWYRVMDLLKERGVEILNV